MIDLMQSEGFGDHLRRLVFQRSPERRDCSHLDTVDHLEPASLECRSCIAEGTRTVHLRMCLTCGQVGCCDSSKAKHARRHYEATGHPLIRSVEPNEQWAWCYPDEAYLADVSQTRPPKATGGVGCREPVEVSVLRPGSSRVGETDGPHQKVDDR